MSKPKEGEEKPSLTWWKKILIVFLLLFVIQIFVNIGLRDFINARESGIGAIENLPFSRYFHHYDTVYFNSPRWLVVYFAWLNLLTFGIAMPLAVTSVLLIILSPHLFKTFLPRYRKLLILLLFVFLWLVVLYSGSAIFAIPSVIRLK